MIFHIKYASSIMGKGIKKAAKESSCAELLKVFADETRLEVLEQLMSGPKHVSEINETLKIDQSLLSHHLKLLRDKGFVLAMRDGKSVLYKLAPKVAVPKRERAINLGCCRLTFK